MHAVSEAARHARGIFAKRLGRFALAPSAALFQRQRQVPVMQAQHGLDATREQTVGESVVKIQPQRVHASRALGQDARPGRREPVGLESDARD